MNSKKEIEQALTDLGKSWPVERSLVEGVVEKIEAAPTPSHRSAARRRFSSPAFVPRNILVKSLIGIAVCALLLLVVWPGMADNRTVLYSRVLEAMQKAKTVHYTQYFLQTVDKKPVKEAEGWFEQGVGFRVETLYAINVGNQEFIWTYVKNKKQAVQTKSKGINDALAQYIDSLYASLRKPVQRCPEEDHSIEGIPCKAYSMLREPTADSTPPDPSYSLEVFYLDSQSRLMLWELRSRFKKEEPWKTAIVKSFRYDETLGEALFQPTFPENASIVDADASFECFVDLKAALYQEEKFGIIYAVHRVERFENGGVLVVSSVRATEETQRKYPSDYSISSGDLSGYGHARLSSFGNMGGEGTRMIDLAQLFHREIDVLWQVIFPFGRRSDFLEVRPGRLRIPVSFVPESVGGFADQFKNEKGIISCPSWNVEFDAPSPDKLSTLNDIAHHVYADLTELKDVPHAYLTYSEDRTLKNIKVQEATAAEYAALVAKEYRSCFERDLNFRIDGQLDGHPTKSNAPTDIFLEYFSSVDDLTLKRIAGRETIKDLYLRGTHITDNGLKHLAGLKNLRMLDLTETPITDEGLQQLTGLSRLRQLYLKDTKVTPDGAARLQRAIPNLEIHWDHW